MVLGTAVAIGGCLAFLFFVDNPLQVRAQDNPLVQRLAFASLEGRTTQTRLAAWRAGLHGIAERPVLGWGPANYIVPYGKYGEGVATSADPHDRAHNELVEEAATKGLLGAAVYIAIWVLTFVVVARYVKDPRDARASPFGQALAIYVGTALVADLLLKQTLFGHVVGTVQYALLIGFVIGLEDDIRREGGPRIPKRLSDAAVRYLAPTWSRALVIVLALGSAGAAAYSSIGAYAGARGLLKFASLATLVDLDTAITAFPPMANNVRRLFLDEVANNWRLMRMQQGAKAIRMLARADIEAAAAERAEPHNWVMIHSIARLYRVVATTEPEYRDKAERYERRALELAPNMEIDPPRN